MKLTNILVPFIKEELYLLINWIHNCPSLCKEKEKEKELNLHLSLDKKWSDYDKKLISKHIKKSKLKNLKVFFHSVGMSDTESVYMKVKKINRISWRKILDNQQSPNINNSFEKKELKALDDLDYGYKNGPNQQFYFSIKKIIDKTKPNDNDSLILLECDTLIIKNNWIDLINNQLKKFDSFWILGSKAISYLDLNEVFKDHLNGNSIYGIGDDNFKNFLETWMEIHLSLSKTNKWLAYDVIFSYLLNSNDKDLQKKYKSLIDLLPEKLLNIDFILNILEDKDNLEFMEKTESISKNTIVIHSKTLTNYYQGILITTEEIYYKYLKFKHPLNKRFHLINENPLSYFFCEEEITFDLKIVEKIIKDKNLYINKYTNYLADICLWRPSK